MIILGFPFPKGRLSSPPGECFPLRHEPRFRSLPGNVRRSRRQFQGPIRSCFRGTEELRRLASARLAREAPHVTLQATVLVHEAWLRLGGDAQPVWQNRAPSAPPRKRCAGCLPIDRARRRQARHRAGLTDLGDEPPEDRVRVVAPDDRRLLAVHEALDGLAAEDPRRPSW